MRLSILAHPENTKGLRAEDVVVETESEHEFELLQSALGKYIHIGRPAQILLDPKNKRGTISMFIGER